MSKFIVNIFSPDGEWTTKEIKKMIDDWFKNQTKKGIAYKIIYTVEKIKEATMKCSRRGSISHNRGDNNCCSCRYFVAPNQKCKKGFYTTRESVCFKYKSREGIIPPPGG